jgi:PIN domain-containing protein
VRHERHGQHFAAGTEDTEWLPFVGEKGWVLLTKDKRIRYNELEKTAVMRHDVREFYFSSGNYSGTEMAEVLIDALRDMVRIFRRQKPPFIASITKSGKAEIRLK